jgi:hypothetical protein
MKYMALALTVVLLVGCGSTRVIDASWEDPVIQERVVSVGQSGRGEVHFRDSDYSRSGPFMLTDAGMRFLGESAYTVDRDRVSEIHEVVTRGRGLAFLLGAASGGAIGAGLGWLVGKDDCEAENPLCEPFDSAFDNWFLFMGGGVGALAGGIVGALVGSPKVEVYRFSPDTPQQMSLAIGVGPTQRVQ